MSRESGSAASGPLHVVIIGAGLAGLATALATKIAKPSHRVTILETVKELQEVGVRIFQTPRDTLLLTLPRLAYN